MEVLKDTSIEIREGGVVCMIGPSGPSKSTFLRCLNRLEKITSGYVVVGGHPISSPNTSIDKAWENAGMMPQHFNLFPHLTVKENIILVPTELKLMGKEEAGRKTPGLLARMGLVDKVGVYPGQFSDRQKQRVVITRSLIMNPDIMLSDELASTLDPEMVGEVLEVVKQLAADSMTMVVTTYEMGSVRKVADRVVFMDDGYIAEEGTPDEVLGNPRRERIKSFPDKVLQKTGLHEG